MKRKLGKVLSLPIGDEKKEWIVSKNPKGLIGFGQKFLTLLQWIEALHAKHVLHERPPFVRYDPGFWPSEWWKKARFDPLILIWKRANLSSFWRTLLIYPFLAFVLTGPIMYMHEEIPDAGTIIITANVFIFFGTWFLVHKWMIKAEKNKQGPRKGSIHHDKGN